MKVLSVSLSAVAAAALLIGGCRSLTTGNEGNLVFSYTADDLLRDFNKPIAVGAKLELVVQEAGTYKSVELRGATGEAGVLQVVSFSGNRLIVEGVADGNALVEVEARLPNGDVVTDSVNMTVRVPDVMTLGHTCTSSEKGAYLVDQDIYVPYELKRDNGQDVIGYGYWPISADPVDGVTLDQTFTGTQFMRMTTSATPGTVVLTSDLDDDTLGLDLVEAADIDGADFWSGNPLPTVIGVVGTYWILPKVGDALVCQARTTVSVVAVDEEICTVKLAGSGEAPPAGAPKAESALVWVTGKAVGTCELDVTHLEGADDAGVTTRLSVEIVRIEGGE